MRIFLIRHGESKANVDRTVHQRVADHAIELTENGVEQAKAAGNFLKTYLDRKHNNLKYSFRMWTSPYQRARETADALLKSVDEYIIDRNEHSTGAWKEHVLLAEQQFGLFDGVPEAQWPEKYPDSYAQYNKCVRFSGRFYAPIPLGESRFDVACRVHQAFGSFRRDAEKHEIENLIVVCHGTVVRAFLMMWLHLPVEWFEEEPNPKNASIRLIEDGIDKGYIHGDE